MKRFLLLLGLAIATLTTVMIVQIGQPSVVQAASNCDRSYPNVCIAPPPPDLDCKDIPYRNFKVLPPDPHRFDRDKDGIGCESKKK
jgi:micrococcal nuclease